LAAGPDDVHNGLSDIPAGGKRTTYALFESSHFDPISDVGLGSRSQIPLLR
jgi:hypothetical protein